MKLTEKQKRFCEEYLIDLNATQAAIRAGYPTRTARSVGSENLTKPDIQKYLSGLMERKQKKRIASSDDVLEYLTGVLSGESEPDAQARDRLKAAELLAKYHGLMAPQQVEVKSEVTVNVDQFNALVVNTKGMGLAEKEEYKRRLKEIMED